MEGWPEDPDWTASITEGIETTLPALEEVIGAPGFTDDLVIRQVAMQALAGYAGDFHPGTGRIRVSERLDDPQLVAHEMAHAWFNGGTLAGTWLIEAYADWAGRAATGGRCEDPGDYPGKGGPKLRRWRFIGANPSDRDLEEMWAVARRLAIAPPTAETAGEAPGRDAATLRRLLHRPLRVCGMVPNVGDPGGGPFWVRGADGRATRQIVESSQVDMDREDQRRVWESSTHFNPVDLVCGLSDYRGRRFDLTGFADPQAGFISVKSSRGRTLKALELPGLWNGSMAHWNTVFVEVPRITFNPVKTVLHLLQDEHRG